MEDQVFIQGTARREVAWRPLNGRFRTRAAAGGNDRSLGHEAGSSCAFCFDGEYRGFERTKSETSLKTSANDPWLRNKHGATRQNFTKRKVERLAGGATGGERSRAPYPHPRSSIRADQQDPSEDGNRLARRRCSYPITSEACDSTCPVSNVWSSVIGLPRGSLPREPWRSPRTLAVSRSLP